MIPPPPNMHELKAGTQLRAGLGISTVLPDVDFETYSEAGFIWDAESNRYMAPRGATRKGLPVVGLAVYATHPSTEVLSMAYDLKDGRPKQLWTPEHDSPQDLFDYVNQGGILEAWSSAFEYWIWNHVCVNKYGFPPLRLPQLRCAKAKSRAYGLPGSLADTGAILGITNQKDSDGKRLLEKFSMPRNPTKADSRRRILPLEDIEDRERLYQYNIRDIVAESEISALIPDLSAAELQYWLLDQHINYQGVAMDRETIHAAMGIIDQAREKYNNELRLITNGAVQTASQIQEIRKWLSHEGVHTSSLDADHLDELLKQNLSPAARRVLEIRSLIGSAAVSKLFTMGRQLAPDGRLHDLFQYHGARTGRATGQEVQPQNLPNLAGKQIDECSNCKRHFMDISGCPWCGTVQYHRPRVDWNPAAVEDAIETIRTGNLDCVEIYFGEAIPTVMATIRGMFIAKPGYDLICSDFSSIEAIVLAHLAGEQWQIDVFKTHGLIYEMTACKITGMDFEEMQLYKATSGKHHSSRKLGKVASLASGYQGWLGAWLKFKADEFLNEEEIKKAILAWRAANPSIVELWGGQERNWQSELYGLEGAVIQAILNPGVGFTYRLISYIVSNDTLFCELPSGRRIVYHKPRLRPSERRPGTYSISYEGWNSNPMKGAVGWQRMDTYGGMLTENVCQAVARDILMNAMLNLQLKGYSIVLHVHDEIVAEVPETYGSVEEFETIMSTMPIWAKDWPIKAKGGWRAKRYAK